MNADVSRRTFLGASLACAAAAATGCGDTTESLFFRQNFRDYTHEERKEYIEALEKEYAGRYGKPVRLGDASSQVTPPVYPSTRTWAPSGIRIAPGTLTTHGIPISRARIDECDSSPPDSATMPPDRASIGVHPTSEYGITRTSPASTRPASPMPDTTRAVPRWMPREVGIPVRLWSGSVGGPLQGLCAGV